MRVRDKRELEREGIGKERGKKRGREGRVRGKEREKRGKKREEVERS